MNVCAFIIIPEFRYSIIPDKFYSSRCFDKNHFIRKTSKLLGVLQYEVLSRSDMALKKFEKRLSVAALIFVAIYIGAAILTIQSRNDREDEIQRIESADLTPAEGRLIMVQLFLPMMIILTLTVCFIIVRKQRVKKLEQLEENSKEDFPAESS